MSNTWEKDGWRQLGAEVRNWSRWGTSDERGTINFIGAAEIRHAASLIRRGRVFDLGIPLDQEGPQNGGDRSNPVKLMSAVGRAEPAGGSFRFNDDYVFMPLQAGTQWDALSHVYYDDLLYNSVPQSCVTDKGAARLGIESQAKGIVGRGLLLDVARYLRCPWMAAGEGIVPDLLERVIEHQEAEVRRGDILLIRTGWRAKFVEDRLRDVFLGAEPGLSLECCKWLWQREVAAVASDNWALEVIPSQVSGEVFPVHMVLIRDMGMMVGEMFDLEELSADCARDGVFEFFFCGPVLKFTGAVGTPVNPLAIK